MAEPYQIQPLEIRDFSGGKTDNYISARTNQFQEADNFMLNERAHLFMRDGSNNYDLTNYQIPSGQHRIGALIDFYDVFFQQSNRYLHYITSGGAWATLQGPTGNDIFTAGDLTNYCSYAKWNNHLFLSTDAMSAVMKIYKDGSGNLKASTLGLPALASSPSVSTTVHTGKNFVYAFVYMYQYTVGTATFQERSAITQVAITNADAPETTANSISSIPVISNSTTGNYDTTVIKVEIYRTTNAGTTFYYVGAVTNGTTTYSDTTSDATLSAAGVTLYNTDSSLDYTQPPPCKYVVQNGQITWFLHTQESGSIHPNRMRPSGPNMPFSAPLTLAEDLDDEIVGGVSYNTYLIVFCKTKVYRVEGFYDAQGRGSIKKQEISNRGCVSHRSIVKTPAGVFFAGEDGFYLTDAFKTVRVSEEINSTYALLVASDIQKARIYGAYDATHSSVVWACQSTAGSVDNDCLFACSMRFGIKPDMPFTTWYWASQSNDFQPSSILFFKNQFLRADSRGYLFLHSSNLQTDPRIDTSVAPSSWAQSAIIYDYKGPALDFGSTQVRKWVAKIETNFKNVANASVSIQSTNDNAQSFVSLKEVVSRSNLVWGDEDLVWGDATLSWNYFTTINSWRRFPAGGLRCMYKQVRLTNFYSLIRDNTTSTTATVDGAANTVTIDDAVNYKWPSQSVGYFISFASDGYTTQWPIASRTDSVLTITDLADVLPSATNSAWKIQGYRKGDALTILSLVIEYAMLSTTQPAYGTQQ